MAMQRPGRPSTRLNQPAVNAPPPKPAARPATRVIAKQQPAPAPAPATGRARSSGSSTRSVAKQSSSRPVPKQAPKSNSTMMIAIGAGVVVVLGIAAFAMSGGHEKPETPVKKEASKPKAVDVAGLERDGMSKCDQGLAIIRNCGSQMNSPSLSEPERARLKTELEKATTLIKDGMAMLDQANQKSGNTYQLQPYIEAKKVARMKLGELGN